MGAAITILIRYLPGWCRPCTNNEPEDVTDDDQIYIKTTTLCCVRTGKIVFQDESKLYRKPEEAIDLKSLSLDDGWEGEETETHNRLALYTIVEEPEP